MRQSIYVQTDIHGSLERLWLASQSPALHEQWDLRFTSIAYLPRPDPSQPQQFLYATRIGFGIAISGRGETVGENADDPEARTSALRFWSDDRKSLIESGSGYWKYIVGVSDPQSVRFVTRYNYAVRFGAAGRIFDSIVFRPLLGWATAWSFDRLRLWIEQEMPPPISARLGFCQALARIAVAAVWLYHGVVPKLLFQDRDELAMITAAGFSAVPARRICMAAGMTEVVIGLLLLVRWRSKLPLWITLCAMPVGLMGVLLTSPSYFAAAFNPLSLNLSVFTLALIAILLHDRVPSAGRCIRKNSEGDST